MWFDRKKTRMDLRKMVLAREDQRKLRKLVEGKSFDFFILTIILADAFVLGLMSTEFLGFQYERVLFVLDRLFMAIFIVEMFMKIFAMRKAFFASGWNVFDLLVVVVSSVPVASSVIVLRSFRLFRMFRFIYQESKLNRIVTSFFKSLPLFVCFLAVFAVFFYVFSILAVSLYGGVFAEFSTIGGAMQMVLQTFLMEGWGATIAHQVMKVFPNAWMFFALQAVVKFLLIVSLFMAIVREVLSENDKK